MVAELNLEERKHLLRHLRTLLPKHPVEEQLFISAEAMLDALARSGDLTIRMIRGVFAEAAFAADVIPSLHGWRSVEILGEQPYDFLLSDQDPGNAGPSNVPYPEIKVQVKMQRSEKGRPLMASEVWRSRYSWSPSDYVVELQRSRKGERNGQNTRPYRFGEFDLVAVSLGPSTKSWSDFVYTTASRLLPDPKDSTTILTYQPVSRTEDAKWTANFFTAVDWLRNE